VSQYGGGVRREETGKHWVHPFFRDNRSSGAYIVSKEINQDPELFRSFYRMSIESFSLLVDIIGPQVRKKKIPIFVQLCQQKKGKENLCTG
jgi:hypothetical protein